MARSRKSVVRQGDTRPTVFPWGQIRWIHSADVSGAEELTFGEVTIEPGKQNDSHAHTNCEEVLYLLEGELRHALGNSRVYHLLPGDAILIPRGVVHSARCVSDRPARMLVAYSSPRREVSGE